MIPHLNKSGVFYAKFGYWSRDRKKACFRNIKDGEGNLLTDHAWITINGFSKFFSRCDYSFHAKIKQYVDKNNNFDYKFMWAANFKLIVERI
jgi:hypothetical protein